MEVLVVGRSRVLRRQVRRALRQAGHGRDRLTEAGSVEEAFDLVGAAPPDLVLAEWRLPDGPGLALLARLRRAGSDVPFGLLAAQLCDAVRDEAGRAGASFVVGKPVTPGALGQALDTLADGGRARGDVPPGPVAGRSPALPHPARVKAVLESLLAREVVLRRGRPVVPTLTTRVSVGAYVDERLRLRALIVADLALAARAGAALGLLSPETAAGLVAGDALSPAVADNVAEALDACTALVNGPALPHLRLYASYSPSDVLPGDVSGALRSLGARLDLDVEIVGYGGGGLSFVRV